jgi:hypothetical protein
MAVTRISDLVIPARFSSYLQQRTEEKSNLIRSGLLVRDPFLDNFLAGAGLTIQVPSFKDLSGRPRVSNDDPANRIPVDGTGTPPNAHKNIGTSTEIAVRLSRNDSWSDMDLAGALAGADPMAAIMGLTSSYWARALQKAFVATVQGIFNDNAAAPTGGDQHVQNDLTVDVSGGGYVAGVTDFQMEAVINAITTLGDSAEDIVAAMLHSHVVARAKKNNLVDSIPDSTNAAAGSVEVLLQKYRVIQDDGLPNPAGSGANQTATGIYHSWFLGSGAFRLGMGSPSNPVEVERKPEAGNGGGQSILWQRVEWCIHPVGHAWIGTAPAGGPDDGDASTANTLAHADSWRRVFSERKQIKIARLITRES